MNIATNFLRGVMGSLGQTMAIGQPINSAGLVSSIFSGAMGSVVAPSMLGTNTWALPTFNGTPLPIGIAGNPGFIGSTMPGIGTLGGFNPSSPAFANLSPFLANFLAQMQMTPGTGSVGMPGLATAGLPSLDATTLAFAQQDYIGMTGSLAAPLTPQQLYASAQAAGNNLFAYLPGLREGIMALAQIDPSFAANQLVTLTSYFWRLAGGTVDQQGNMTGTVGAEQYINGLYGLSQYLGAHPVNAQQLQQYARTNGISAALAALAQNGATVTQPGTGITPQLRTQIQQFFVTPRSEAELAAWLTEITRSDLPATPDGTTLANAAAALMSRIGMSGPLDTALFASVRSQFPAYTLNQTLALYCFKRLGHTGGMKTTTGPTVRGQIGETITIPDTITGDEFLKLFYVATTTTTTPTCPTCPPQYVQPIYHMASNPQQQIIQQPGVLPPIQVTQGDNKQEQHQEQHQNVYVTINMKPKTKKKPKPAPVKQDPLSEGSIFKVVGDPKVFAKGDNQADWDMMKKTRFDVQVAGNKTIPLVVDTLTRGSKTWPTSVRIPVISGGKPAYISVDNIAYDLKSQKRDGPMTFTAPQPMTKEEAADLFAAYSIVKENKDGSLATPDQEGAELTPDSKIDLSAAFTLVGEPEVQHGANGQDSIVINLKQGGSVYKFTAESFVANPGLVDENGKALMKQTVVSFERVSAAEPVAPAPAEPEVEDEMPEVIAETRNDDGTRTRVPINTNINNNGGTQSQDQNDGGGDAANEDIDAA